MTVAILAEQRRRLLVPAASTCIMLIILVSLGVWQVHRLAWKNDLLAAIERAEAAPAIPLPTDPQQFQKVQVVGRFRPDLTAIYGAQVTDRQLGPTMGGQMLVPLERAAGPPILVDRGWVPDGAEVATQAGIVSVTGYVRVAEHPSWFSAPDDPANRHFYTLDPSVIGRAVGLAAVAPFTLVVLAATPDVSGSLPIPALHLPRPPNDHLSYAITWFGLATVLLVVFVSYVIKNRK